MIRSCFPIPVSGQVAWFLPGMFSFLLLIVMAIPVQEIVSDGEGIWLSGMLFPMWISYGILRPYINTTDAVMPQQEKSRTWDKLKYLPVSKRQYNLVRIKYVFNFVWKLTAVGMILQCVSALICIKRIEAGNILYAAGILFVVPLMVGWLCLLTDKWSSSLDL